MLRKFLVNINPFLINFSLLYSLKTLENLRFSDVFREYESAALVENRLIVLLSCVTFGVIHLVYTQNFPKTKRFLPAQTHIHVYVELVLISSVIFWNYISLSIFYLSRLFCLSNFCIYFSCHVFTGRQFINVAFYFQELETIFSTLNCF